MTRFPLIALLAGTVALAGCNQRELILPGQRLDPRAVFSPDGPPIEGSQGPTTAALSLPAVRGNADWTNVGGNPAHFIGNVAIGQGTNLAFAANIGQASDRRHRITADPIVGGGLVYTLDSRARVTATMTSGQPAWSQNIADPGEIGDSISGGGIAYEGGRVFVTTGYGEVVALDARSGGVIWRQKVEALTSGAPTVADGVVYIAARNATGWAIRASDGRALWQVGGNLAVAGVMGASSPAVSGKTVVFPFASGQLIAVDTATGQQLWTAQVAGSRKGRSIGLLRDMTGDPVIVGNRVYAGTSSGRIAAFDLATGVEVWNSRNGAMNPPLVAGNSIFAISDESQLVRIDAANGATVWSVDLPQFTTAKVKKQAKVYAHFGPVLAGSKLYVASSDGKLRIFSPANGALLGEVNLPAGASADPVVAGQTLYVVTESGQLIAYR
ncbi:outer membrane protein assembly factor BamB family protein [Paracoccus aminophilus]|uniref:Pyrrolo-quinoline quinone n=1 Tax=Paracoccus aminophilus JCM 7686 TaxID=1367847 RepID=S5XQS0_PARAH|nr:PQQ-binding-like beta-propeller repeat protein [Paracoccus aminophilus]AGT09739.1 pyrrolo-quinoline quinone [Paracoccus aminophilus JCM 7686]